ncbi:two component transcriptional regulator, LuxR family [Chthoniobacter flavus Ellin428]|uniref:Two component transcriptional regulator, LuxR family n=1 Tax=Chthoniobacter flavus Ellin428 TaxID=497964 RepID=B4CWX5_9BACT|nr:response regulator transcription factor [Chthoniobacter flavus]EDY21295.1 two component transcriptional regulator, LuxR family [Chthoniobacter flavus Ellin428]TCO84935.1 LuxR family two component transcriptional regulator [Chthoniobacter flavus]
MPKLKPIRILVVDDHHVVRSGLAASLGLEDDLNVVGEAGNAGEAVTQFRKHHPDVVLMDLRLPGANGTAATADLRREWPDARVLMFTTFDGEEDIYRAMQAGARGYLLKSAAREELLSAIRAVAAGERHLSAALAQRLAGRVAAPDVSDREREVLQLIARGKANKEIAAALGISEETVKRHASNLFVKMGVADRAQATSEGIRRGLIQLE